MSFAAGCRIGPYEIKSQLHRHDEAMTQILRAVELNPLNTLFQGFYAQDFVFEGRYDEGIEQARKTLKVDPDNRFAREALWGGLEMKGMDREALDMARADNADDKGLLNAMERGNAEGGYKGAMRRAAEALERRPRAAGASLLDIASCWNSAGDLDRALDWLEKALEEPDPGLPYVVNPPWKNYANKPRFQTLLTRMGLPQ